MQVLKQIAKHFDFNIQCCLKPYMIVFDVEATDLLPYVVS